MQRHLYQVEIEERLQRIVTVMAETSFEAIDEIEKKYYASGIVLDSDDFAHVSFRAVELEEH